MRNMMIVAAALVMAGAAPGLASAQKIDKNGRCHAASGQFAKAEVCGGAARGASASAARAPATAAAATTAAPAEVRSATAAPALRSTRCKNDKGRFAKCGSPGAHPAA